MSTEKKVERLEERIDRLDKRLLTLEGKLGSLLVELEERKRYFQANEGATKQWQ